MAVVGAGSGDTIALLDVTDPAQGKVKEVLWKMNFKGNGLNVQPSYPAYVTSTGRCVFIGQSREGLALYSFERGQADPPKRLEPAGYDSLVQDVVSCRLMAARSLLEQSTLSASTADPRLAPSAENQVRALINSWVALNRNDG